MYYYFIYSIPCNYFPSLTNRHTDRNNKSYIHRDKQIFHTMHAESKHLHCPMLRQTKRERGDIYSSLQQEIESLSPLPHGEASDLPRRPYSPIPLHSIQAPIS